MVRCHVLYLPALRVPVIDVRVNIGEQFWSFIHFLSPFVATYVQASYVCKVFILVLEVLISFLFLISIIESLIIFICVSQLKLIIHGTFYFNPYIFLFLISFWFL